MQEHVVQIHRCEIGIRFLSMRHENNCDFVCYLLDIVDMLIYYIFVIVSFTLEFLPGYIIPGTEMTVDLCESGSFCNFIPFKIL